MNLTEKFVLIGNFFCNVIYRRSVLNARWCAMQRGGGEDEEVIVAISPPPQFQDTPTQPPPVFADCLTDFASRISFDILNEAMVIATGELVLLHGPQDVQQHGGGPSSSHISPGSPRFDNFCLLLFCCTLIVLFLSSFTYNTGF